MSDHLLRLAKIIDVITHGYLGANNATGDVDLLLVRGQVRALVRELEAAQTPTPERRPITREEFQGALSALEVGDGTSKAWHHDAVRQIAAAWRLTVEDA